MKFAILAALIATTQAAAGCNVASDGAAAVANCACNAACTDCVGVDADTAATALASNCIKDKCATDFVFTVTDATADANLGTCAAKPADDTAAGDADKSAVVKAGLGQTCVSTTDKTGCVDGHKCAQATVGGKVVTKAETCQLEATCSVSTGEGDAAVAWTCSSVALGASIVSAMTIVNLM